PPGTAREEAEVVGLQLDQVQDRRAREEERHHQDEDGEREGRGIDAEPGSAGHLHDLRPRTFLLEWRVGGRDHVTPSFPEWSALATLGQNRAIRSEPRAIHPA